MLYDKISFYKISRLTVIIQQCWTLHRLDGCALQAGLEADGILTALPSAVKLIKSLEISSMVFSLFPSGITFFICLKN